MSTSVGTLQPKVHLGAPFVAGIALALFVAATIGVYALTTDTRTGTDSSTVTISGTAANTPSELRGVLTEAAVAPVVRPLGRAGVIPRVAEFTASANTPSELGTVISFSTGTAIRPLAKPLGVDVVAGIPGAASITVEQIAARNAMLASYHQSGATSASVEEIAARNAMLGSYQQGSDDEIVVNGEVCQICWKYR